MSQCPLQVITTCTHALHQNTRPCPPCIPVLRISEAVRVAAGVRLELNRKSRRDLERLRLHLRRVVRKRHQPPEGLARLNLPVLQQQITRRLGEADLFLDSLMLLGTLREIWLTIPPASTAAQTN